ncbi:glycosyltransferase [Actinophytocola sp.]|uniref:glycosyltransferase n=1 Tax=Actinophytocola sp. TaxID=1872138 RepID=UPI003899A55F
MKVLTLAGISPSTVFSHAPLSNALRNEGHEVMMTASLEVELPTIAGLGLPAVRVTNPDVDPKEIIARGGFQVPNDPIEREQMSGRWYARLEAATLDPLLALAKDWRPDVVIGGICCYAAPLLAAHLGVPWVRHGWDIHDPRLMDLGAVEELDDLLSEVGIDGIPVPDMMIDITPPSLRPADARPTQMMRWVPGNTQRILEPWMYAKGGDARIGVTIGTGVASHGQFDLLQGILDNVRTLDAEVVVAVTDKDAVTVRERVPDIRAGWIPLDVVAPTCDVIVHQSGGSTMMTALSFGVPQVLVPEPTLYRANDMARRLVEAGVAITLTPDEATSDVIAKSCQEIISNPAYAKAAAGLRQEIAGLPSPAEVARRVEQLV